MEYTLEYRRYWRPFKVPLNTSQGTWKTREGILIRLTDASGKIGYGEAAPVKGFSQENLGDIEATLAKLGNRITDEILKHPSFSLPSLSFALDSASQQITDWAAFPKIKNKLEVAALLPAGAQAIESLKQSLEQEYSTFKWKIGAQPIKEELSLCSSMLSILKDKGILRLDANGALTQAETVEWLKFSSMHTAIDFLEQPLAIGQEALMADLSKQYSTSIALDESVTSLENLKIFSALFPHGPFVIKTSLLESISDFIQWRSEHPSTRLIYSSAFETAIGIQTGLYLAASDLQSKDAIGFGTLSYFEDDCFALHKPGSCLIPSKFNADTFTEIWNQL